MYAWEVLLVPAALFLVSGLLLITARLEQSVLSPRSIILRTVKVRNARPDHVEELVAAQYERLLHDQSRP